MRNGVAVKRIPGGGAGGGGGGGESHAVVSSSLGIDIALDLFI
jgi:hypothetical protein